jgi:hypothetical protein
MFSGANLEKNVDLSLTKSDLLIDEDGAYVEFDISISGFDSLSMSNVAFSVDGIIQWFGGSNGGH